MPETRTPNLEPQLVPGGSTLRDHFAIARVDHWIKNTLALPGVAIALAIQPSLLTSELWWRLLVGMASLCLMSSSNYVINEVLDAPFDRKHPTKCHRPVPAGRIHIPLAYAQWLALMVLSLLLATGIDRRFVVLMASFFLMGVIYNFPPIRTKDKPYLDVVSEAINNPLRLLAGWFIAGSQAMVPASLLLCYWMIGCFFMGLKRFAEYRLINDGGRAASYRKSFSYYTEERLLTSVMFYSSAATLFLGAFTMRYRLELILSYPLVAFLMAIYLDLAFKKNSAVQAPEKLYREYRLLSVGLLCAALMGILMFLVLPFLYTIFWPSVPIGPWAH